MLRKIQYINIDVIEAHFIALNDVLIVYEKNPIQKSTLSYLHNAILLPVNLA